MEIALVNVALRPYLDKAYFPIGLSYVATALERAGYAFDVIDIEAHRHSDAELQDLLGRKQYDVIALGTLVSGYRYAKSIAAIARRTNPQATIVAGNSLASSIPEHLLTHTEVDIAVKGEGEIVFVSLLRALERNPDRPDWSDVKGVVFRNGDRVIDTGYEDPIVDINAIPHPHWELFDMNLYLSKSIQDVPEPSPMPRQQIRAFVVNTARGCPFRCSFCYHVFQYCRYRYRSPESVLAEVAELADRYGVNFVNFFDELTFHNKQQVSRFVEALLTSGLKFYWNADVRGNLFTEKDLDLLFRLREAGCVGLGYSLESGNPDILKRMNKRMTVEEFSRQKLALDRAGIRSFTSIVLGYPEETLETLRQTFDVCYDLGIYPSTGYLLPQPGTLMFEAAAEKGHARDLEQYLMQMGDRQDLRFNLTDIPSDLFQAEVSRHLARISEKMALGLKPEQLIKTFTYVLSQADGEGDQQA